MALPPERELSRVGFKPTKESLMIRNLKVLGLAVVAALALTAVIASAAQATAKFTVGASSGTIKSTQTTEQVFTTSAGTVRCTTANQEGSYTAASFTSLEVSATYSGCKAFGFLSATVAMNGCKYNFASQANETTLANVDIVCPAGKDITVTTTGCVVHVEPQTGLQHVTFQNGGGSPADDVNATATITGVKYTATSGCPGGDEGTTTANGSLTGGATVKAFNTTGTQVNLTVDDN
jgi:hypothetical protein